MAVPADLDRRVRERAKTRLKGLTPVGRVTIEILGINEPEAVKVRRELRNEGLIPPID